MHPLAAIVLVILTGLAWLGTTITLLVSLAKARRQPPAVAEERVPGPKGGPQEEAARIPL